MKIEMDTTPDEIGQWVNDVVQDAFAYSFKTIAPNVFFIVYDQAVNRNQDMFGFLMPEKKKGKSQPLVDIDSRKRVPMMAESRWSSEKVDEKTGIVEYLPPDYFWFLIEKPVEDGGRPWISQEQWNPTAMRRIETALAEEFIYG